MLADRINKEINDLEENIKRDNEYISKLKNYTNLSFMEKIELGMNTSIRYDRDNYINSIMDGFNTSKMKNSIGKVGINNFVFEVDDKVIYIPFNKNNGIEIKYITNLDFKPKIINNVGIYEDKVKQIDEKLKNLSNKCFLFKDKSIKFVMIERNKLINKKCILDKEIAILKRENSLIELYNKKNNMKIESEIERNINFMLSIKDDIEQFLNNGFKVKLDIFVDKLDEIFEFKYKVHHSIQKHFSPIGSDNKKVYYLEKC